MKNTKELQESLASLSTDFEKLYKQMKAYSMDKPEGGADYNGQPNLAGNVQQVSPTDTKTSPNSNNLVNKNDFAQWAQGCMAAMSNIHNRIDSLSSVMWKNHDGIHDRLDKHMVGHIPAIQSAGKMNKALAALGLDDDYKAEKKTVYASRTGPQFEVEMKPISKN